MIENLTFARPYAKAIFSLALQQDKIKEWEQMLEVFSLILEEKNASEILNDPNISLSKKLEFFFSLTKEEIVPNKNSVTNFIKILASKHHFNIIPQIKDFYKKMSLAYVSILPAKVISAFPLEEYQVQKLQMVLEKKFQSRIYMNCSASSDLIGGAVVHVGDWVIDGSVKGKLKKLKEEFKLD